MGYLEWLSGARWFQHDRASSHNCSSWQRESGSILSYAFREQTRSTTPALNVECSHENGLKKNMKVPIKMAEDMRSAVAWNIQAKTAVMAPNHQQPQSSQQTNNNKPGYIQPPTGLIIEDTNIHSRFNPYVAIELRMLVEYKKRAESAAQSSDDTAIQGFWLDLADALAEDCGDVEWELGNAQRGTMDSVGSLHAKHRQPAQTASTPAVHHPPQNSVHNLSPHVVETRELTSESTNYPQISEHRDILPSDEPAELTATATMPPSSQNSSRHHSLLSTETSESDMGDRTEGGENELYRRVRHLHNVAREISVRLYPLRLRQKNFDLNLDEKEQGVLKSYRAQLAAWDPLTSNTVSIESETAFEVEIILSRKRDALGPLLHEIQELEREYHSVQSRQQQVEDQLHRHYINMHLPVAEAAARPGSLSDSDAQSEASELELFDPSEYHPLYNEWQDREARLKNLQEKLWTHEEEEARLASQKEIRGRVSKHLAKEDEEELAALPSKIADLRARFEKGEEEAKRMKEECLRHGIIDEYGKPRQNIAADTKYNEHKTEVGDSSMGEDMNRGHGEGGVSHDSKKHKNWDGQSERMKNEQERQEESQGEYDAVDDGKYDAMNEGEDLGEDEATRKEDDDPAERHHIGVKYREPGQLLPRAHQQHNLWTEDGWELVQDDYLRTIPGIASPEITSRDELEQQPDLNLLVSPPSESETRSATVDQLQSASALLIPPAPNNQTSQYSEYPMFALSTNRHPSPVPSHSDSLSVDDWLFGQLIDSGTERRLLATILQAKGATDYDELEDSAQKVVNHWNDDSYAARHWSPARTQKDLRESVEGIKREGYDKLLVKQVIGYALEWKNCAPETGNEYSEEDEEELPDY